MAKTLSDIIEAEKERIEKIIKHLSKKRLVKKNSLTYQYLIIASNTLRYAVAATRKNEKGE